ncbi:MAG: sigma-E factor negative regulatory protein [Gammaproteobacteria bacterium]
MRELLDEKLSLLLDDQLDSDQAIKLLETVRKDEELQAKFRRYALISQALKSEQCSAADTGFVDRIHSQLENEPIYFLPKNKNKDDLKKMGMAVAASVLLAVVWMSSQQFSKTTPLQADVDVLAQRSAEAEEMNARFKEYLQAHDNVWYVNNDVSVHPYARVASYQQK